MLLVKIEQKFITNNPCYQANVNKADSRYTTFQNRGALGLVLHSVGCAQPSANVFYNNENKSTAQVAVHAFIDANTGTVLQVMPWNYRAWHCGHDENNTHIGVEMCESSYIKYKGVSDRFDVVNKSAALAHAKVAYDAAVELFAYLCKQYNLDPKKKGVIKSHNEIGGHTDPEHYWTQLGAPYTMDGFRKDVAAKVGKVVASTVNTTQKAVKRTATVTLPYLEYGDNGNSVKALQGALFAFGYVCGIAGIDGDFGKDTKTAVMKYQKSKGLDDDGVVGKDTWTKLLT